jgi:hypothetical protein
MDTLTLEELEHLIAEARHAGATDDTPVHFSYNYGDHWRTTVAPAARAADMLNIEYSGYHQMDKLTEDEGDKPGDKKVFVIS